jgi:hypothetical protein
MLDHRDRGISRLDRTQDKVHQGFSVDSIVNLSPLILSFLIDYLRVSRCVTPDFLLTLDFWPELVSVPVSRRTHVTSESVLLSVSVFDCVV